MTVIINGSAGDREVYHSDVCRVVWRIKNKQYWNREDAEAMGFEECQYCSGEYPQNGGGKDFYYKIKRMGEANAD